MDLALWGHVHNAIVTCPVINGTCVTTKQADGYDGPVHAVIGHGGMSLDAVANPAPKWVNYQVKQAYSEPSCLIYYRYLVHVG